MTKLSLSFFSVAALCGLAGMVFGVVMGATGNFTLSPSHAHLNLVGWASLAIMGAFYALTGKGGALGWINFVLSSGGAIVLALFLALMLAGNPELEGVVIAGSVMAVLGMLAFVAQVLSGWTKPKTA